MAGDLEDFLRRAAERRQAKQQQPRQAPPAPQQQPPQQRRAPRQQPEEIVVAEVVEDPYAGRREKIAEAKRLAEKARAEAAKKTKKTKKPPVAQPVSRTAVASTGNVAQDLIALLRRPGGIQQAVLLREILERPEHRW